MQGISIKPISAFSDNYIWMLIDEKNKAACVVDPGDPDPNDYRSQMWPSGSPQQRASFELMLGRT